jgi:hypothetical protein
VDRSEGEDEAGDQNDDDWSFHWPREEGNRGGDAIALNEDGKGGRPGGSQEAEEEDGADDINDSTSLDKGWKETGGWSRADHATDEEEEEEWWWSTAEEEEGIEEGMERVEGWPW